MGTSNKVNAHICARTLMEEHRPSPARDHTLFSLALPSVMMMLLLRLLPMHLMLHEECSLIALWLTENGLGVHGCAVASSKPISWCRNCCSPYLHKMWHIWLLINLAVRSSEPTRWRCCHKGCSC